MDCLSGVIAVVQISESLFNLCRGYYLEVKDARKDIQRFCDEVTTLRDVLISVQHLVEASDGAKLSVSDSSLKQCRSTLEELVIKLELHQGKEKMRQFGLRALKWPFSSNEVHTALAAIERHKNTISLALNVEQRTIAQSIETHVLATRADVAAHRNNDKHDKIMQWLSKADPSSNHHSACKKHQPGTGEWLINRTDFEEWKKTPGLLLWLHGIPGCGKTILSSVIIEQMKTYCASKPNLAITYFYFDFNEPGKQNATNFISTLISQLCNHLAELPQELTELYKAYNSGRQIAALHTLKLALFAVAKKLDTVFIVADALDECPNDGNLRKELLELMNEMCAQSPSNIHLLVTSRSEPDISELLLSLSTTRAIPIQGPQIESDIKLYICSEISTDSKLKKFPSKEKERIEKNLVARANGMFRWVFCQLDVLKTCKDRTALENALGSLPKTLHETYKRILLNIGEHDREKARRALIWLAFSRRPLRVEEVAEAAVLDPQLNTAFDPEKRLFDPTGILEILGSLVTRSWEKVLGTRFFPSKNDVYGEVIRLAHFSVQEYLVSEGIINSEASMFSIIDIVADRFIAECCLQYIFFYDESDAKALSKEDSQIFPLLGYAGQFWYIHFGQIGPENQKPTDFLLQLFLSDTALSSWIRVHQPWGIFSGGLVAIATPLHYASYLGFENVVQRLLEKGADVNAKNEKEGTALHLAAEKGHEAIARLLLEAGAEVDSEYSWGATPLYYAVLYGHSIIVRLLLAKGANEDKIFHNLVQVPALG